MTYSRLFFYLDATFIKQIMKYRLLKYKEEELEFVVL